jgi:hypothetical protein
MGSTPLTNGIAASIRNIKMLAQVRRLLAQAQLDDVSINAAVRLARIQRVKATGMRQYLHDMLKPVAHLPARECALLGDEGCVVPLDGDISLVDYLERHYTPETLPMVVLAPQDGRLREFVL